MLKRKTAVVTGSTSGIGLGIATALGAQGANVMLNGFGDALAIEAAQRQVAATGAGVGYHGADMARPPEIRALIEAAARQFGGVDVLVNNAGIQHVAPIESFADERWDAVIAVNLSSAFHAIKHALPLMRAKGWGRIVNIASTHGLVASAQKTAYVAAKHGIVGLTKAVALETANSGVTCNAICPGWVLTQLVQQQIGARARAAGQTEAQARIALLSEKQPELQFTTPEDIGAMVVFLCSDAARVVRGASYVMDGGWTAQ